jgi:hypothetical protein
MLWLSSNIIIGVVSSASIVLVYLRLARTIQLWTKAVVLGAISTVLIVLIYVTPPYEDSHFAGANFAYNFLVFFPVLLSSFVFWLVAAALYLRFLFGRAGRSLLKALVPPILLLPLALQVGWMVFLIVYAHSAV